MTRRAVSRLAHCCLPLANQGSPCGIAGRAVGSRCRPVECASVDRFDRRFCQDSVNFNCRHATGWPWIPNKLGWQTTDSVTSFHSNLRQFSNAIDLQCMRATPDHMVTESDITASPLGVGSEPLVWIDCEGMDKLLAYCRVEYPLKLTPTVYHFQMTGLDPDKEEIIEIYCIITTGNLEIVDPKGYHAVIHQNASRLDQMDEWCTRTHGGSGLTAAVLASSTTPEQAADGLYSYITRFIPEKRKALLAGNSVHADRSFLRKEPYAKVVDHLHYRILDISAIKEAVRRWCPAEVMAKVPTKKGRHLARDDILESIEEAKYYRDAIFQPG